MSSIKTDERRHFTRIAFDADAELIQQGKRTKVALLDISLKGVLVELPKDFTLAPKAETEIEICLDNDHRIHMQLEFAHHLGDHTGFNCTKTDIDSITMLKRLAELNLGDHELLERELENLTSI